MTTKNQQEKTIQKNQQIFIEKNFNTKIIEEDLSKVNDHILQEHDWLILSKLDGYFDGLRNKIRDLNNHLFEKYKDTHSREEVISLIVDDIIFKYKKLNHIELWSYIFDIHGENRKIVIDTTINRSETYKLADLVDAKNNEFFFIKEKRIKTPGNSFQKPDFAMYLNGLPLFIIETKTDKNGLQAAAKDAQSKIVYREGKFLGIIGLTSKDAFISMMPNMLSFFYWKAYGNNKGLGKNGFEDLFLDVILNPTNLMFYMQYSTYKTKSTGGQDILINHRCQQYYALKKADKAFNSFKNNQVPMKKLIKHVQRSGKSITMRSIVFLLLNKHDGLFKKIAINTPDTVIQNEIQKTFNSDQLGNGTKLIEITSRKHLADEIKKDSNNTYVYLFNMQKMDTKDDTFPKYKKNDILFILDEAHTHQSGLTSDFRNTVFPKASYFAVTATPRLSENGNILQDKSNAYYNDSDKEYFDEFNASDALELGIIVPIKYMKGTYKGILDQLKTSKFDEALKEKLKKVITDDARLVQIFEDDLEKYSKYLDTGKHSSAEKKDLMHKKEIELMEKYTNSFLSQIKDYNIRDLQVGLIESKLNYIVEDIVKKRTTNTIYLNPVTNEPYFKTKQMWFVENINLAVEVMGQIKTLSGGSTTYKGIRFAVDFSDKLDGNKGEKINVDELNGYYDKHDLISEFESSDDGSIDVLILVNKRLMGYDEPKVTTVYLDKIIREPSKLFQLVTRPATVLENKRLGYIEDLTFGESNFSVYKKALSWYDSDEDERFFLTEDIIQEQKENIKNSLDSIVRLFDLTSAKEFTGNNLNKLLGIMTDEKEFGTDKINVFFRRLKEIQHAFKLLITPQAYVKDIANIYEVIKLAFQYRVDILGKEDKSITLSKEDMRYIVDGILGSLNIQSTDELFKYDLDGSVIRMIEGRENLGYSHKLEAFKVSLRNVNSPFGTKTLFDYLTEEYEKLKKSDMADELNQQRLKELEKKKNESMSEAQKIINNDFNGDAMHFIINKMIKNFFDVNNVDLGVYEIDFINVYVKKILNIMSVKYSDVKTIENVIPFIIDEDLNDLKPLDGFKNIVFNNDEDAHTCKKLFNSKIIKHPKLIEEVLTSILEEINKYKLGEFDFD
jgi:type I site-specific restriction-modification system R (restriction) subunit